MRNNLGVSLRAEDIAVFLQFFAQLGKIFDDAIVDNRNAVGKMRVRDGLIWNAVRCPAGVDANEPRQAVPAAACGRD